MELTSLQVLTIAIRSEIDAQNVYRELAERVSNPTAKERFHVLVAEEQQHQKILEKKYKEYFPDVPLKLPASLLPPSAKTAALRKVLSLQGVLKLAIQAERESREIYLDAAAQVEDRSGKAMLRFLADWEYTHQMMLTAEHEMLLKYPNFYDEAEPWPEDPKLRRKKS